MVSLDGASQTYPHLKIHGQEFVQKEMCNLTYFGVMMSPNGVVQRYSHCMFMAKN